MQSPHVGLRRTLQERVLERLAMWKPSAAQVGVYCRMIVGENVQNAPCVTAARQILLGAGEQSTSEAVTLRGRGDYEQADHGRVGRIRRHSAAARCRQHESDKLVVRILGDDPALCALELCPGACGNAVDRTAIPSSACLDPETQAALQISR